MAEHCVLSRLIPSSLLVVAILTGCGGQTTDEYISSAQGYIQNNEQQAAVIELKNALKQEPDNIKARRLLGVSYLETKQVALAEKELLQALKLGADVKLIYPNLLRAFNLQNKYQEIVDQPAPKGLSQQDDILTSVLRGVSYLKLDQADLASLQFDAASELDANSAYSKLGQAYRASSQDKLDEAMLELDATLKLKPNFTEALMLKASLALAKKDLALAVTTYQKLMVTDPKNFTYKLQLAKVYMQQKLYPDARLTLTPVLKRFPKHPHSNLLLAELEYSEANYKACKDAANLVLASMENSVQAKYLLGLSSFKLNDYEQAHRYLSAVEAVTPKQHPIRKTLALVEYEMGYFTEAAGTLNEFSSKTADEAKLFEAIGLKQVRAKDFGSALGSLEQALELDPQNHKLKAKIGVLKLAEQDISGLADLDAAVSGDPSLEKIKLYEALYYLENKQYKQALAIAKKWQADLEFKVRGYNLEALVYLSQKQLDKAVLVFNKTLSIDTANKVARQRLATIAIKQGNRALAKKHYLALLQAHPAAVAVLTQLASLALADSEPEVAKTYFITALQTTPKADAVRLKYAQLLIYMADYKAAMQELELISEPNQKSVKVLLVKARLLQAQNNIVAARASLELALELQPKNLQLWLRLLTTYKQDVDSQALMQELTKAIKVLPNSLALKRIEIAELIKLKKFELAFKKVDTLRAKPELLVLADEIDSRIYLEEQKIELALQSMQKAFAKEPNEYRVVQLASLLSKLEQEPKAEALLQKWLEQYPEASNAKQAYAMLLHKNKPNQAIAKYRAILKSNPQNITVLNNLAWLLAENKQALEAVALAKQAVTLAPKSGAVLDTYGYCLLAANQAKAAVPVLEQAIELVDNDLSIQLHLAQAYYNSQRLDAAKPILATLQQKIKAGASFDGQDQVAVLLKKWH